MIELKDYIAVLRDTLPLQSRTYRFIYHIDRQLDKQYKLEEFHSNADFLGMADIEIKLGSNADRKVRIYLHPNKEIILDIHTPQIRSWKLSQHRIVKTRTNLR